MRALWGSVLGTALLLVAAGWAVAGPFVYVSNERSNDVTIIDAATDAVVATVKVGDRPRGIAAAPDGRQVYVAISEEDIIAVLDTASRQVTGKLKAGSDPEAFAVSPDG